jgi:hypothetical protein
MRKPTYPNYVGNMDRAGILFHISLTARAGLLYKVSYSQMDLVADSKRRI